MAGVSGRERMLNSVNGLTGGPPAAEAILAQERPRWALPLVMAAPAATVVLTPAVGWSGVLIGALIGAVAGLLFATVTTYWIVARVGDEVLFCRSSKLTAKATAIEDRYPAPLDIEVGGGVISRSVTIGPATYFVARQFIDRLTQLVR